MSSPRPYLPLPDIAAVYGISPRTARRWAAHDRWDKRRSGTAILYSVRDAHATYERLRLNKVRRHLVKRYGPA